MLGVARQLSRRRSKANHVSSFRYSTAQFPFVVFTCPVVFEANDTRDTLARYEAEVLSARRTFVRVACMV